MRTIKKNLAVIALLLGMGTAFATISPKQTTVLWTQLSNSSWQQVSGAYSCDQASIICTRAYPAGQNPNTNPNGYVLQENGVFAQ